MEVAVEDPLKEGTENMLPAQSTIEPTPQSSSALQPQEPPRKPKKEEKVKKEDKLRRDDKSVELFMKSLNSVPSFEEKLQLVCKKYVQTADENKKLQYHLKQMEKRFTAMLKEKDQLQLDFNKTILVKSKLENLCRELQKQNKNIKEESLLKIREEEERRKETQTKFQHTVTEITSLLQQNSEKNAKLRDDNIGMSEKFKSVMVQYQLREQQLDKMTKQMALENQLADARLQKARLEHIAEKEKFMAEMEAMKVMAAEDKTLILELQRNEINLRSQLAVYTDKYDEFQTALVKSNQVFGGFKEQMDKMSKKIKNLEQESLSWKKRFETSQSALLDMCSERQTSDEKANSAARQLHHMQSLCRTLQGERTALLNALKEHNIDRPQVTPPPVLPPPPPPVPAQQAASNSKVEAMAANCANLRKSLANLQSQLNVLTTKQSKDESLKEAQKEEKSKKSKSKKFKAQKISQEVESPKEPKIEEYAKDTKTVAANLSNNDNKNGKVKNDVQTPEVDDETIENLLQAINNANINLCDLEIAENNEQVENGLRDNGDIVEEILRDVEANNEVQDKGAKENLNEIITDSNAVPNKENIVANEETVSEVTENVSQNDNESHVDGGESVPTIA